MSPRAGLAATLGVLTLLGALLAPASAADAGSGVHVRSTVVPKAGRYVGHAPGGVTTGLRLTEDHRIIHIDVGRPFTIRHTVLHGRSFHAVNGDQQISGGWDNNTSVTVAVAFGHRHGSFTVHWVHD